MPNTSSPLLFILLLLASNSYSQLCTLPGANSNDLLQAGTTLISNTYVNTPAKREHLFTFTLNFNAPAGIRVAASASSFQVTANNGVDFSIWGGQGTSAVTGMIILLINQDNSWSSIRVSYLASGRSDFFLGSFSAGLYFIQRQSQSNVIVWNQAVTGWISSQRTFNVIVELAGLKTASTNPVISLTGVSFNSASGTISTTISVSATPFIQYVVITYIIADRSSHFTYTPFSSSSSSTATYQFFGIDQLQSGNAIISGNGFTSIVSNGLTCVGSGCRSSCITSQLCIANFGVLTATNCFICAPGQIVSNGQCVAPISPCSTNQYFNGTSCVCNNGFIMVGSACFVSCGVNAYVINSQCQCIPGFIFSNAVNQCVQSNIICGSNFVLVNNQCVCPSGFGLLNGLCVICSTNSYIDQNGNCLCSTGFTLNPTTRLCQLSCFPNAFRNSLGQCVCINGFYNQGNLCVPQGTCQNSFIWDGTTCVCPLGTVVDNFTNTCTACNAVGRVISNGRCVCSPTYYPTDTSCLACIPFSTYNPTSRTCICSQNYILVNNQCLVSVNCPANSFYNTNTLQCVCNVSGQFIINGTCQTCQQFSVWNGTNCVCQTGYILNAGLCIQNCGVNSFWNGFGCVCNAGYFIIAGVCQLCDVNSLYSNTQFTCVCNNGYFGTWNNCTKCDASCATCSGPNSFQCLTCPSNTIFTNGACKSTCAAGTYLSSNFQCLPCDSSCTTCSGPANSQCLTCPSNTLLINGVCKANCGAGTYLSISNQCLPCDSSCATCSGAGSTLCTSCLSGSTLQNGACRVNNITSRISLRGHVLGNQIIYQGVSMSLMPTAILSGGCSICNNLFTVTVNSQFATITVSQQYLANTQYWFMLSFAFPDASTIPSFEFTIRINPIHANFFTSQDMAQLLTGSFTQSMFNSASTASTPTISTPIIGTTVINPTVLSTNSNGFDDKTIEQIFGNTGGRRN